MLLLAQGQRNNLLAAINEYGPFSIIVTIIINIIITIATIIVINIIIIIIFEVVVEIVVESFRFEDENKDEDEDEALGFRHKEIFKLFRLQLHRDNVVAINFVVPAKLNTIKFEDFVVAKTESFVLVLESKAL